MLNLYRDRSTCPLSSPVPHDGSCRDLVFDLDDSDMCMHTQAWISVVVLVICYKSQPSFSCVYNLVPMAINRKLSHTMVLFIELL